MFSSRSLSLFVASLSLGSSFLQASAYDNSASDNLAVYWGQNSYGASNPTDTANWQQPISYYCQDDTIDAIPIAFVDSFFGTGGLPVLDLANTCNLDNADLFEGTELLDCSSLLASDIQTCQAAGKIVTVSLGGGAGSVGFTSDEEGQQFAQTIWDLFLGGSSTTRPFGDAVLDGVDLDIEGGGSTGYAAFITQLQTLASGADKQYYFTAAPQCPFPDANLGSVINAASFDAIYVQFYNNYCGVSSFDDPNDWNFGTWDNWAKTTSPNPDVKIYIGAPAASSAANSGSYVDSDTLATIIQQTASQYSSFGGVMLWDASQAYANDRYDVAVKSALTAAAGGSSPAPASSTPATSIAATPTTSSSASSSTPLTTSTPSSTPVFTSSTSSTSTTPSTTSAPINIGGVPSISVAPSSSSSSSAAVASNTFLVSSPPVSSPSSVSVPPSTVSVSPSTVSVAPSSTVSFAPSSTAPASSSSCDGLSAWADNVAYVGGDSVTYNGNIWTAKWWSYADIPGGVAGDWTEVGSCSDSSATAAVSSTAQVSEVSTTASSSSAAPTSTGSSGTCSKRKRAPVAEAEAEPEVYDDEEDEEYEYEEDEEYEEEDEFELEPIADEYALPAPLYEGRDVPRVNSRFFRFDN